MWKDTGTKRQLLRPRAIAYFENTTQCRFLVRAYCRPAKLFGCDELRHETGFVRKLLSELYPIPIMLTRGRAQRLLLKATELEGLEAHRFLFRRYEAISAVTTDLNEAGGCAGNNIF